jgi:SAM-dependent methyltransferase
MTATDFAFTEGAAYERFMGPWTRAVGAVFLDWLAIPEGQRWLDIGCGTGVFTELILEKAAPSKIVAIDPAPAQIFFARGKPAAARADFRIADAESLPFDEAGFDVVASALALNFIPEREKAVAEMRRVTRPGGCVAGYVWDLCGPLAATRHVVNVLREMEAKVAPIPGVKSTRLEALGPLFEQAGLVDVELRAIEVELTYPDFDAYWRRFTENPTPASLFVRDLPPAGQEVFRSKVSASLPAAPDETITFSARANGVKGFVSL